MTLENKVMHKLKPLNENLPDVIVRHEELIVLPKFLTERTLDQATTLWGVGGLPPKDEWGLMEL